MTERRFGNKASYPIPVWNGVLEHRKRMGSAIWEFLWCLDRTTRERDGVGLVLGGKPIKAEELGTDLKENPKTVQRHLDRLERQGYVRLRRTPCGHVIEVLNSRKFGIWSGTRRPNNSVPSGDQRRDKIVREKGQNCPVREDKNVLPNKDSAVDSARNTAVPARVVGSQYLRGQPEPPSADRADSHLAETEFRQILKTIAGQKDLRSAGRSNGDGRRAHLEKCIYRKRVAAGYFDCAHHGLSEAEAVREAIHQAALDLTSNRAVELRGIDPKQLRDAAFEKLQPHIRTFAAIGDYKSREQIVVQAVVRGVADAALVAVETSGKEAALAAVKEG